MDSGDSGAVDDSMFFHAGHLSWGDNGCCRRVHRGGDRDVLHGLLLSAGQQRCDILHKGVLLDLVQRRHHLSDLRRGVRSHEFVLDHLLLSLGSHQHRLEALLQFGECLAGSLLLVTRRGSRVNCLGSSNCLLASVDHGVGRHGHCGVAPWSLHLRLQNESRIMNGCPLCLGGHDHHLKNVLQFSDVQARGNLVLCSIIKRLVVYGHAVDLHLCGVNHRVDRPSGIVPHPLLSGVHVQVLRQDLNLLTGAHVQVI